MILERVKDLWYRSLAAIARLRRWPEWEEHARNAELLPVWSDWSGFYAIDRTGEAWFSNNHQWQNPIRLVPPDRRHLTFVLAGKRYRSLRHITPKRPDAAVTCPTCRGLGRWGRPAAIRYQIMCGCGDIGWIDPDWLTDEYRAKYPFEVN